MTIQRRVLVVMSSLAVGLGGCQSVTQLSQWDGSHAAHRAVFKVTPLPADIPERSPDAAESEIYQRAVAAIDRRDYGLALDMLQLAREGRDADPRVLTAMGVVYDKLGRFDLSKRYYDLAEKADPGSKVVAADRAYSVVLQQRTTAEGRSEPTVMAVSAVAPPPAANVNTGAVALALHPTLLLIRRAIRIQNATGMSDGAESTRLRLANKGWSINRTIRGAPATTQVTLLRFPPDAQRVANGLAHTLPFRVTLESCPSCAAVELLVGTDALASAKHGQRAEVRRA